MEDLRRQVVWRRMGIKRRGSIFLSIHPSKVGGPSPPWHHCIIPSNCTRGQQVAAFILQIPFSDLDTSPPHPIWEEDFSWESASPMGLLLNCDVTICPRMQDRIQDNCRNCHIYSLSPSPSSKRAAAAAAEQHPGCPISLIKCFRRLLRSLNGMSARGC